jgi:hypothetical protein
LPGIDAALDGVDAALLGRSAIAELGATSAADGDTAPTDVDCDALAETDADGA